MKVTRGVAAALREARGVGLFLVPRPAGAGVRIEHGAFLAFAADATPSDIRAVVESAFPQEKRAQ